MLSVLTLVGEYYECDHNHPAQSLGQCIEVDFFVSHHKFKHFNVVLVNRALIGYGEGGAYLKRVMWLSHILMLWRVSLKIQVWVLS